MSHNFVYRELNLKPQPAEKTHRVLSDKQGENAETLCRIPLTWKRNSNGDLIGIFSARSGKKLKVVWKDNIPFTCNTCNHVYRNITRPRYNDGDSDGR